VCSNWWTVRQICERAKTLESKLARSKSVSEEREHCRWRNVVNKWNREGLSPASLETIWGMFGRNNPTSEPS
jgi:hypothetical protein